VVLAVPFIEKKPIRGNLQQLSGSCYRNGHATSGCFLY
jgi:hypothetical protein